MFVVEPQPAKAILASRRITNRALARHMGVSPAWVGRVLNGWAQATPTFRQRTSELLGLPEHELFHPPAERSHHPGDLTLERAS